jgi:hypothetical protein
MIRIERSRRPSPYNPEVLERARGKAAEYFNLDPAQLPCRTLVEPEFTAMGLRLD